MKFRKLRITWSVLCAIVCVLSIVLWVRSYWHGDVIEIRKGGDRWLVGSGQGWFLAGGAALSEPSEKLNWWFSSHRPSRIMISEETRVLGFQPMHNVGDVTFSGPYWICLLVATLLGRWSASPWIYGAKRFSLRTLLIAITLVAMVLGMIVAVI